MAIGPPEPIDTSNRPGHVAPTREAVALRQSRIDNRDVSRIIAHARNRDKVPHDKAQAIRESAAVCKSEVPTLLQGDQGASEDMRRSLPPSPQTSKRQTASDGHPSRDAEPEAAQTTSRTAAKSLTPLPCRGTHFPLPTLWAILRWPLAPAPNEATYGRNRSGFTPRSGFFLPVKYQFSEKRLLERLVLNVVKKSQST
jgi:hypothetical protein